MVRSDASLEVVVNLISFSFVDRVPDSRVTMVLLLSP
jgi:hypothetical protein